MDMVYTYALSLQYNNKVVILVIMDRVYTANFYEWSEYKL